MEETFPIYAALAKAQAMVSGVGNDAKNQHHGYRYTSAEALIAEGRRCLSAQGLALIEQTCEHHFDDTGFTIALTIVYLLVHVSGAMPVGPWTVPVMIGKGREADKAEAAARTYSLGYVMRGLLMIDRPSDEDEAAVDRRDDRDSEPRPTAPRREQQRQPREQRGTQPSSGAKTLETCTSVEELVTYTRERLKREDVSKWTKWPAFKTALRARCAELGSPETADMLIEETVQPPEGA